MALSLTIIFDAMYYNNNNPLLFNKVYETLKTKYENTVDNPAIALNTAKNMNVPFFIRDGSMINMYSRWNLMKCIYGEEWVRALPYDTPIYLYNDEVALYKRRGDILVVHWNDKNKYMSDNESPYNMSICMRIKYKYCRPIIEPIDIMSSIFILKRASDMFKNKYFDFMDLQPIDFIRKRFHFSNKTLMHDVSKYVKVRGNVSLLHGCFSSDLSGNATVYMYGNVSRIKGVIHERLSGDVSGLSGDITNLIGDCTGLVINIPEKLGKITNVKSLVKVDNEIPSHFRLLSNSENVSLFNAYRKIAHCTLGITDAERKLIDNPTKQRPPFNVDKWGRHYFYNKENDELFVYSINPADIAFLKDVNKIYSCFSFNSSSDSGNNRWDLGMRCLMALNCINPNLGCAFIIKKNSYKKCNQYRNIKFNWYEPEHGVFFQYDSETIKPWYYGFPWQNGDDFIHKTVDRNADAKNMQPIYGHDGVNKGHSRQSDLGFLEDFIKPNYSWAGIDKKIEHTMIVNNSGAIILDENGNDCGSNGDTHKLSKLVPEVKKIREIINAIEI